MTQSVFFGVLLVISLSSFSGCAAKPVQVSLDEYCASNPCRKNVSFKLRTDGPPIDETVPYYWPVVMDDQILILPGESIFIEVNIEDGKIVSFRDVPEAVNPQMTIQFTFKQMDDLGMMLVVQNPFKELLKYHANMIDFSHQPHQTSSCPVTPNGSAYESWPHPIPELHISNLRLLPMSNEVACTY